ncbi:hypothetical protein TNCV_3411051 [Trichonephila clavipes]|nr:hypothetical protein TNCV_3411051 [Trichonephila clavipes]
MLSQHCPSWGLNLGPVVWKRDALTPQPLGLIKPRCKTLSCWTLTLKVGECSLESMVIMNVPMDGLDWPDLRRAEDVISLDPKRGVCTIQGSVGGVERQVVEKRFL